MDGLGGSEACLCQDENTRTKPDQQSWMIECDVCHVWFHGECVDLNERTAVTEIDKYHCPRCEPLCGPSIFKDSTNCHRHDRTDPLASSKATQVGTPVFIEDLKRKRFVDAFQVIDRVSGWDLTAERLRKSGFENPVFIEDKEGLGLKAPFVDLEDIAKLVGRERPIEIIDVHAQTTVEMKLEEFVKSFSVFSQDKNKVLNCLSLEVSDTTLGEMIQAPKAVNDLCWVNSIADEVVDAPKVSKYCIMSMGDSYTDFHVDFGGTSVWYHVLKGAKVFYLVRPTTKNLGLFERWNRLPKQSETFFADMAGDECFRLIISEGQTVLLPAGWIHAVFTPKDSIVFGGNFLNSIHITMQLKIFQMEEQMRIPSKLKYPSFRELNWKMSRPLCTLLLHYLQAGEPSSKLLSGMKNLFKALKDWGPDYAPPGINPEKLVKELNKDLKQADKMYKERKSKSKKSKTSSALSTSSYSETPPIKLTIPMPLIKKEDDVNLDLTDRDAVRKLMVQKRKQSMEQLDSALGDALMDFGDDKVKEDDEDERRLQIDISAVMKKKANKGKRRKSSPTDDVTLTAPEVQEVYQDKDFVYTALEYSDDEDLPSSGKMGTGDSAWSPRAKVKYNEQKRERLPRDNAKRIEVERGLKMASKRLKKQGRLKKKSSSLIVNTASSSLGSSLKSKSSLLPTTSPGLFAASSSKMAAANASLNLNKQPKKGKTAKQRLGKILKLKF